MIRTAFAACAVLAAALALPAASWAQGSKELNILNWADYIAPDTIAVTPSMLEKSNESLAGGRQKPLKPASEKQ